MRQASSSIKSTTDLSKARVVFVSHGAPSLAIDRQHPSYQFFKQLGKQLGRPKAIVCISAHWEAQYAPLPLFITY